jgi:hypothetical protein
VNVFIGVFGFQKKELGDNQVGNVVIYAAAQKNDALLEQSRVDVI